MNTLDLDQLIDAEHAAAQKAEEDALAVEKRLRLADLPLSAQWFAVPRQHGEIRSPYAGRFKNLTVRTHLERLDPPLAAFLARAAGVTIKAIDYDAQDREIERQAAAERMKQTTAELAARNAATRQLHDQARHMNVRVDHGNPGAFRL